MNPEQTQVETKMIPKKKPGSWSEMKCPVTKFST